MTIIETEHASTEPATETASKGSETIIANTEEITVPKNIVNNEVNADDRPRNTQWADAEGNPTSRFYDVYGRWHTIGYFHLRESERPLFNGNLFHEEWNKFFFRSENIKEIAENNNIHTGLYSHEIIINTDGSIDVKPNDHFNKHQTITDEILRVASLMPEQGKITPGSHEGEVMNVMLPDWVFNLDAIINQK